MFGLRKRRIRKKVTELAKPFVQASAPFGRLPEHFWSDAYVLGFLISYMSLVARAASNNKITPNHLVGILYSCLSELSSVKINEIVAQSVNFMKEQNPDFVKAQGRATVLYISGVSIFTNIDEVQEAKQAFISSGIPWDVGAEKLLVKHIGKSQEDTSLELFMQLWVEEIAERFNL